MLEAAKNGIKGLSKAGKDKASAFADEGINALALALEG